MQSHYYAEYYKVEESHGWFRARRRILRSVLGRENLWGRDVRVLDVGSGTGRMLEFLREGMVVTGTDKEMEALRFAAKHGATSLVQSDAVTLPIRAESVDAVTAFDIIEHLEDDRGALEEFRRVLKPGGSCVVTVPAFQFLWSEHDEINMHLRRYRSGELRCLFVRAGFQVTRCSYFNTLLFAPIAGARLGHRLLDRVTGRSGRGSERPSRSDFSRFQSSVLGAVLERVMGCEARLINLFDFPIGVSIVLVARRP